MEFDVFIDSSKSNLYVQLFQNQNGRVEASQLIPPMDGV